MGDNNESLNDPIKLISLDNLSTYHDLMDAKKEEHSVTLTLAQYNALSPEEKMNGKTYYISDAGSSGMVITASDVLMTGYSKASSASAITTNDTGSIAFGKLEKGLDDVSSDVDDINGLIPSTATVSNKLATASDIPDVSNFITKAVNDLNYYYTSSNTYTKTEVDNLIAAAKNGRFIVVSSLPTTDIDTKAIYLLPKSTAQTNNVYDEYVNTDGTSAGWEKIGDTQIDLSNYVQKSQTAGLLKNDGTVDTNSYETTTNVSGKENLKLASSGTTASGEIRFGVDGNGNYGYIKAGADSVTPFKNPTGNKAIPQITQNGTVTDIDVADYATASLDIAVPAPTHTGTYTPAANKSNNDMGANHNYRYVNTSGMKIPSGTKNIYISENGSTTVSVNGYDSAKVTASVVSDYEKKIRKKWSGYTSLSAFYIWTDGDNIYYSNGSNQYVLDKTTCTWSAKTWNGLTSFNGSDVWTDGINIYYSYNPGYGNKQYVLDKLTSTWNTKTWSGANPYGQYIWNDGENIYYSKGSSQYVLKKSTSTWSAKTWNGLTNFDGKAIWKDGDNIYYSHSSEQYILNKATSTWSAKTWNGSYTTPVGWNIWTDGDNIYMSGDSDCQYVLDKATSTWNVKTWNGLTSFIGSAIWTDGDLYYMGASKVLDKIVTGNTWYSKDLT